MPRHDLTVPLLDRAERGVFEQPYRGKERQRFLVAITRQGELLAEATIYTTREDPSLVTALLRFVLDHDDPVHLRLTQPD